MNDSSLRTSFGPAAASESLEDLAVIFRNFRLEGERVIRIRTGEVVTGTPNGNGYLRVWTGSKSNGTQRSFLYHRIKFALAHGWLPAVVDHRDRNPANNYIANLRAATRSQNAANADQRKHPIPKSGHRNVRPSRSGKYGAYVKQGGERIWLGTFDTAEEAKEVVEAFKRKHRGDFYNQYSMKRARVVGTIVTSAPKRTVKKVVRRAATKKMRASP